MQPVQIYSIAAGSVLFILFLYRVSSVIFLWIQRRTIFYVLKYLVYPVFLKRRLVYGPTSPWETLLILLYWSGTAACNLVGITSFSDAGLRAAAISLCHLVPLLFSDRLCIGAYILGISPRSIRKLHTSFGVMAVVQGIAHVAIYISRNALHIEQTLHLYGLLVRFQITPINILLIPRRL